MVIKILCNIICLTEKYNRKKRDGKGPMEWMDQEALIENLYTYQPDVWSFGILLREIITYIRLYLGISGVSGRREVSYRLLIPSLFHLVYLPSHHIILPILGYIYIRRWPYHTT
uniref:Fibroblast growth factor receptor 1-A n=1 Tax=Cacopsylla melanoneura TaxID=428564 RepID=A0A8D8YTW9_9HEMI